VSSSNVLSSPLGGRNFDSFARDVGFCFMPDLFLLLLLLVTVVFSFDCFWEFIAQDKKSFPISTVSRLEETPMPCLTAKKKEFKCSVLSLYGMFTIASSAQGVSTLVSGRVPERKYTWNIGIPLEGVSKGNLDQVYMLIQKLAAFV